MYESNSITKCNVEGKEGGGNGDEKKLEEGELGGENRREWWEEDRGW